MAKDEVRQSAERSARLADITGSPIQRGSDPNATLDQKLVMGQKGQDVNKARGKVGVEPVRVEEAPATTRKGWLNRR